MNEMDKEDLKKAYRSEKDPKIRARILAVHSIPIKDLKNRSWADLPFG